MWQNSLISPDQTHHILNGEPFYSNRFLKVGKFHSPGLAPVKDERGAYHINPSGLSAYHHRYIKTFGFYEGRAVAVTPQGACHIDKEGTPIYKERYKWCGNYQGNACVVRDTNDHFFHIDSQGRPLYAHHYAYVGDFKDGYAVARDLSGESTHIDYYGQYLHHCWFDALDVFHKGFARAKDEAGWFHINTTGQAAYAARFKSVEPFYNGLAYCCNGEGKWCLVDERGQINHVFSGKEKDQPAISLSSSLVSFWHSHALMAFLMSEIPHALPETLELLATQKNIPQHHLLRLLRAIGEIGVVEEQEGKWHLRVAYKDIVLPFLTNAAYLWHEMSRYWINIEDRLSKSSYLHEPIFKEVETNKEKAYSYHQALLGYAQRDFNEQLLSFIPWKEHESVLGIGRTALPFLKVAELEGVSTMLYEKPWLHEPLREESTIPIHFFDFTGSWPSNAFDILIFPRILMHYGDETVKRILSEAKKSSPKGQFFIFEPVSHPCSYDLALLDLNILLESGGKLRTQEEWHDIANQVGLTVISIHPFSPILSAIVLQ